jgi:predicted ATPase/DNA-binding SARP family transcriptional activator
MGGISVSVLGPVEARRAGLPVDLGSPQQRALLALLALHEGSVVPFDAIVDGLWPDAPPRSAGKIVQTYVSRLRKALGAEAIVRHGSGYALVVDGESLDLHRFQELTAAGEHEEALALWRGPALADIATLPGLRPEAERLEELRLRAIEERLEADLGGGRHAEVVGELRGLVAVHPLRERLHGLLMLALYRAGRQADALAAYQAARRLLVEALGIEPGPALRELEKAILAQDPGLAPPPEPARTTRLPSQPTPFLGRRRERIEIVALLQRSDLRLLTLTGAGGSGKTRLALRVASELEPDYPDGVFWVPLASLRDPALVLSAVAEATGVQEQHGATLTQALSKALAGKRALLVLDNAEHLLPAAADEISTLHAAGVRLLVTSRERLQLRGEHVYGVPPMRLEDAVSLFVTRSAAVGGSADLSPAMAKLCRRLDNLPLALELAAARTLIFSPEQLLRRLDQRLDLLKAPRDADPRHQTLRATIEWSYELLSEEEQRLFRHLAVFAGGCTFDAAEAVCEADPDLLQSLVDKSLLRFSTGRFLMLETIRAYAQDENERHADFAPVRRRHAGYYLAFAQETKAKLSVSDRSRWVEARAAEQSNLREALDWSIESGSTTLARELAIVFSGAALVRTPELRDWLQRALDMPGDDDPVLLARTLKADGYAALIEGDYDSARAHLEASLPVLREAKDGAELADAIAGLAEIARIGGHAPDARRLYKEAIELATRSGAQRIWPTAVFGLAHVEFDERNYARARELLLQLDIERFVWALDALGDLAMAEGDFEGAAGYYRRCIARAAEETAPRAIVYGLAGLAGAASLEGDKKEAGTFWGAVETLSATLGSGLLPHDEPRLRTHLEDSWNDPSFAAGRAEGRSLSLDEAVAFALERRVTSPA